MSDHDPITCETDAKLRARLRAFAEDVEERTDAEAALRRLPRRGRPSATQFAAIAACLVVAVAIAADFVADRRTAVEQVPASLAPATECPEDGLRVPRAPTPTNATDSFSGGQMAMTRTTFAAPVAALILLGACSDDGPTTLASGEDVNFVGHPYGLDDRTMDLSAEEEDGEVTGEVRFEDVDDPDRAVVADLECADTETDDVLILGGVITDDDESDDGVGDFMAVIIREGEPDLVTPWFQEDIDGSEPATCEEFLAAIAESAADPAELGEVVDGDHIETD